MRKLQVKFRWPEPTESCRGVGKLLPSWEDEKCVSCVPRDSPRRPHIISLAAWCVWAKRHMPEISTHAHTHLLHTHTHTHTHTYTHIPLHTHRHTRTHTYTHINLTHTLTHTHTNTHTQTHTVTHTHTHDYAFYVTYIWNVVTKHSRDVRQTCKNNFINLYLQTHGIFFAINFIPSIARNWKMTKNVVAFRDFAGKIFVWI